MTIWRAQDLTPERPPADGDTILMPDGEYTLRRDEGGSWTLFKDPRRAVRPHARLAGVRAILPLLDGIEAELAAAPEGWEQLTPGKWYVFEGERVSVESLVDFWRDGLSVVYSRPGGRSSRGQRPVAEFLAGAAPDKDPRNGENPWDVRPLLDAIRILSPRHAEAARYLSDMLDANYTSAEVMDSGPLFDNISVAVIGCQCPQVAEYVEREGHGCLCGHDELVLRAYARGCAGLPPMSLPQRERVISDADHDAEGALDRAYLETLTDQELAAEALGAMADYVASQFG